MDILFLFGFWFVRYTSSRHSRAHANLTTYVSEMAEKISWESCVSHSGACLAGVVISVIVLIVLVLISMHWGYSVSKPPQVVVAPGAVAVPTSAVAAGTTVGKECFATPYDLDPATAQLLKYRMQADPRITRRERMTSSENANLVAALGGAGARI